MFYNLDTVFNDFYKNLDSVFNSYKEDTFNHIQNTFKEYTQYDDYYEDDGVVYYEFEVPGFEKSDIEITFEDSVLYVKAKSKTKRGTKSSEFKVVILDEDPDFQTDLKNGILTVFYEKPDVKKEKVKKIALN